MGTSQINARGAQQAAIAGESHVAPKPAEHKDADMSHLSYDFGNMSLYATAQGGNSMDKHTQSSMSQHFGADFGGVKIHTDDHAANLNRQFNARAFTVNNNIYFNEGEYKPGTKDGQHLLAHELVHTIQQRSAPSPAIQAKSIIDRPDSLHEKEADSIANSFSQAQDSGYRSSALQMRSNVGITPLANAIVQRMPKTSGGEWFATNYNDAIDKDGDGKATPVAWGMRGVDINLKFTPNDGVDAELIGLSQAANTINNKAPKYLTKTVEDRSIKSKDAQTTGGESDEGTHIDRASAYNNPIYPVDTQPSKSLDDPSTSAGWGQNGWHYKDKGGALKKQDAILIDGPRYPNAEKNSSQIFETTALATKGAQAGTYYGSVRWGWRTDDKGNFKRIDPITVVSEGVPSSTFMKSAQLWNAGKDSSGANTVDLPIVDVKVTTTPITAQYPPNFIGPPLQIPAGTRVQIIQNAVPPNGNGRIRVVQGIFTGSTLEVTPADMASLRAERP